MHWSSGGSWLWALPGAAAARQDNAFAGAKPWMSFSQPQFGDNKPDHVTHSSRADADEEWTQEDETVNDENFEDITCLTCARKQYMATIKWPCNDSESSPMLDRVAPTGEDTFTQKASMGVPGLGNLERGAFAFGRSMVEFNRQTHEGICLGRTFRFPDDDQNQFSPQDGINFRGCSGARSQSSGKLTSALDEFSRTEEPY